MLRGKKSFIGFSMLRLQDISSAAGEKKSCFMPPGSAAGGKKFVEIIEKRGGSAISQKCVTKNLKSVTGGVKNLDFLRNVIYEWSL